MPTKKDNKAKPKPKTKPKAKPKSTKPTQSQSQHVVVNINKPSRKPTATKSKSSSSGMSSYATSPISYSYPLYNRNIYATGTTPTVVAQTAVSQPKVETVSEPVKANIKVPEEIKKPTIRENKKAISRISVEPLKSESEISSISNKSIRFQEPTTFRYSDIEKINPSPYPSEMSVGSGGFSGSESDAPTRLSKNAFMQQQAEFMVKGQKQYTEKQEKPKTKMRIQFPEEEGGYLTGVTQNSTISFSDTPEKPIPIKSRRERVKREPKIDYAFGLPPSGDFTESDFASFISVPTPKRKYVRSGKYTKENIGMGKEDVLAQKVENLSFE